MLRPLPLLAVTTLFAAAAAAQDAAALADRETKLVVKAVAGLHGIADAYAAQKQHGRALALRRELIQEYAGNDEKALEAVGFKKAGDKWEGDPNKLVLDKDLAGDPKVVKKIDADWATLQKDLLAEHRALAEGWTKVGDTGKAMNHWRRVQRFAPGDKRAAEAMAQQLFEGFAGSDEELGMLRRSRAIRGAVDWLLRKQFEVRKLDTKKQPLLEKAGVAHLGVMSEHFKVYGNLPEAQLTEIALFAERALFFAHSLIGTSEGTAFVPKYVRELVFVSDASAYGKVLDQCADQFDAARLAFLKKDVDLSFLACEGRSLRFYKVKSQAEALDQTVRGVVQDALGITTDGLWEGVGHAACGFFFGRTLTFLLELQNERTAAGARSKPLLPDMATWRQIAEQSAWAKNDTRTSELVLLSAARFTTEQRVKAWAMCDYLFHVNPDLVLELDKSQNDKIRSAPEVEAEFQKRTNLSLTAIDGQWREFWGKNEQLRKAMAADLLGDPKGKDRALREQSRAVVDAVDDQRVAAMRGPVGFHLAGDAATLAAMAYADELAKVEAENKKIDADPVKKAKGLLPLPEPPAVIGRSVLFARGVKPEEALAKWLARPSYRDALMHPGRGLLGARATKAAFALSLDDPVLPTKKGLPLCWPRQHQTGVPGSAVVGDLGPRAIEALAKEGKQPTDVVGMPITLHFARPMSIAELGVVTADVFAGNLRAHGVLVRYVGDEPADDQAPGCVAFVPFEPLQSGTEVEVTWTVPRALLGKGEKFQPVRFVVK